MASNIAQAQQPPQDTTAFEVAYGMSYYGFDGCGDAIAGSRYRAAVLEKFEHCPFSPDARTRFREWVSDTNSRAAANFAQYLAAHDSKYPERLDGMKESCEDHRKKPEYLAYSQLLEQYAAGQASFESVVSFPCDEHGWAP